MWYVCMLALFIGSCAHVWVLWTQAEPAFFQALNAIVGQAAPADLQVELERGSFFLSALDSDSLARLGVPSVESLAQHR